VGRKREQERVAVGRSVRRLLGAERAAGAAAVFNDHLLAQGIAQPALHDAGDDVGAAARRVRNDEAYRLAGPVLRAGRHRGQ
jgi:hypothetical protein